LNTAFDTLVLQEEPHSLMPADVLAQTYIASLEDLHREPTEE
jgi:hypothetical protein